MLVISVDVLDAATVTFDNYEKTDGERESKYKNYNEKEKDQKFIIEYDAGILIDYVMASASVPEFYDYTTIQVQKSNSIYRTITTMVTMSWGRKKRPV